MNEVKHLKDLSCVATVFCKGWTIKLRLEDGVSHYIIMKSDEKLQPFHLSADQTAKSWEKVLRKSQNLNNKQKVLSQLKLL